MNTTSSDIAQRSSRIGLILGYGVFFLLGCISLIGYFMAGGTPSSNLIGACIYTVLILVFAEVVGWRKVGWVVNLPLSVAIIHYLVIQ